MIIISNLGKFKYNEKCCKDPDWKNKSLKGEKKSQITLKYPHSDIQ